MEDTALAKAPKTVTQLSASSSPTPSISVPITPRNHPAKLSKPPTVAPYTPGYPPPASKSVIQKAVTVQREHLQNNLLSQQLDKLVSKKSLTDVRVSKAATAKADKAAEKAAEIAALAAGRASLDKQIELTTAVLIKKLSAIEDNIDQREEDYIRTTWAHGNVLRGWDGLARRTDRIDKTPIGNASGVGTGAPKHRKCRTSDRIFSLSSSTSKFKLDNPDVTIQKRPPSNNKKKKKRT